MIKTFISAAFCFVVMMASGCGTMPQTRDDFIDVTINYDGFMKSVMVTDSGIIAMSYDKAVTNLESQVKSCISRKTQSSMRGATFAPVYQQNNPTFVRVNGDRAEFTLQQMHTGMFGQPEGGFYLLAANMARTSDDQTQLDIYSQTNYQPIIDAVKQWANGSSACHGISGKD